MAAVKDVTQIRLISPTHCQRHHYRIAARQMGNHVDARANLKVRF
jgi:hypothetical protein